MEEPRSQELNVTEVFKEISHNISQYNYRPRPEDWIAIRGCCIELSKPPAIELTAGAVGGYLLGSALGRRLPAICIGMFLCFNQIDRAPAAESCLHRIINLPTPLGAEATEIVRAKDRNSSFLRQVTEFSSGPGRIATGVVPTTLPRQLNRSMSSPQKRASSIESTKQDEPLWATSDPFDICADPTASGEADEPHNDAKNLVEERRRKRQEAYRMRRELRKQQRQGVLVNGLDNDADVFSRPPR